jgi:hypothetical protein
MLEILWENKLCPRHENLTTLRIHSLKETRMYGSVLLQLPFIFNSPKITDMLHGENVKKDSVINIGKIKSWDVVKPC